MEIILYNAKNPSVKPVGFSFVAIGASPIDAPWSGAKN